MAENNAGRPADDARDVHDKPDESDAETPEETLMRHEELHHEHRSRIDALCKHVGMTDGPEDDVRDVRDQPDKSDSIRKRRRHD